MSVLIFGGTTEGRNLATELSKNGIQVTLSVATDYGKAVGDHCDYEVMASRLNADEMAAYLDEKKFEVVVDATHPYANIVTQNIKSSCEATQTKYVRLIRDESQKNPSILYVENYQAACDLLSGSTDNILLTIGSKELHHFTNVQDYASRCFVRMIPMIDSLQKAIDLGFKSSNTICMQGPFDIEMNKATLIMTNAKFLVTKDSGDIGGFHAKIEAATELGVTVIVVARPIKECGLSYKEMLEFFNVPTERKKFPLFIDLSGRKILVVGGGVVAERRIKHLVQFGAEIVVISKSVTDCIRQLSEEKQIKLFNRAYEEADFKNYLPFLVIAATNDRSVNKMIGQEAKRLGTLHIVSDHKEDCDCYFPALAESESFIAGLISKDGNHLAVANMAKQLRSLLNGYEN